MASDHIWSQSDAATRSGPGDCWKRSCFAHFSNKASESRAPCKLFWYQIRLLISIVGGSHLNVWLRFNPFPPSLDIFTHCCQETIYSACFKDVVNICCCTDIKQEVSVLRTEVRLLLVLAAELCCIFAQSITAGPVCTLSCVYFSSSRRPSGCCLFHVVESPSWWAPLSARVLRCGN